MTRHAAPRQREGEAALFAICSAEFREYMAYSPYMLLLQKTKGSKTKSKKKEQDMSGTNEEKLSVVSKVFQ